MNVDYELLKESDLEELLALYLDSNFILGYGEIEEAKKDYQSLLTWYKQNQMSKEEIYYSIWLDDKKNWAGFVSLTDFEENEKEAWLSLGIKPTFWGQGIGTKILKQFIQDSFINHDLKTIRLSVFAKNRRALSLYLKLGFEIEWIYHKYQAPYYLADDIYQLYLNKRD